MLFVHTKSEYCLAPVQFIRGNNLPIKIIRLDNANVKRRVMNNRFLPIRGVPTLIIREGRGVKQYNSLPKVMEVLEKLIRNEPEIEPEPISVPKKKKKVRFKSIADESEEDVLEIDEDVPYESVKKDALPTSSLNFDMASNQTGQRNYNDEGDSQGGIGSTGGGGIGSAAGVGGEIQPESLDGWEFDEFSGDPNESVHALPYAENPINGNAIMGGRVMTTDGLARQRAKEMQDQAPF